MLQCKQYNYSLWSLWWWCSLSLECLVGFVVLWLCMALIDGSWYIGIIMYYIPYFSLLEEDHAERILDMLSNL